MEDQQSGLQRGRLDPHPSPFHSTTYAPLAASSGANAQTGCWEAGPAANASSSRVARWSAIKDTPLEIV
jgi:hypothetical protein